MFDAHASVLFDQRLCVGVLQPFLQRLNIYKEHLHYIFGNNIPAGKKLVARTEAGWTPCKMPKELLLMQLCHLHFHETVSGLQVCPASAGKEERERQVASAQCPVVVLVEYSQEGAVERFCIYISGILTFKVHCPGTALYYYVTSYYVFHIGTKGATDTSVALVARDEEVSCEEQVGSADMDADEESEGGPCVGRLGVSSVIVKGKRKVLESKGPDTTSPATKKPFKSKTCKRKVRVRGKKDRSVPAGMYDVSMSIHVMARVLLNVVNTYTLEMDRPLVASARILQTKMQSFFNMLRDMEEKNKTAILPICAGNVG